MTMKNNPLEGLKPLNRSPGSIRMFGGRSLLQKMDLRFTQTINDHM